MQYDKVYIYRERKRETGGSGCGRLEISQLAIEPDPLNYLSNLTHLMTHMDWVGSMWVGQVNRSSDFFAHPLLAELRVSAMVGIRPVREEKRRVR